MLLAAALSVGLWRVIVPVDATVPRPGYASTVLPKEIDPEPEGDYHMLRLVDESGNEVPFAIDPDRRTPLPPQSVVLSDTGFVKGKYSQAVIDGGTYGLLHDTIVVKSSRPTYILTATVEASPDRKTWRMLRTDATIFHVADANAGNATITFPATRDRWLRLRVLDAKAAFDISGVLLDHRPPQRESLSILGSSDLRADGNRQQCVIDLAAADVGAEAALIESEQPRFSRSVTVESSADLKTWTSAGEGTVERFASGLPSVRIVFGERYARYWRVTVENGNDAPLASARATMLGRRRTIVWEARPEHHYRLLGGNPEAVAPQYDLGERLARENWTSVVLPTAPAQIGPARNLPWNQRFPWSLNLLLAAASLVVVVVALRVLKSIPPDPV